MTCSSFTVKSYLFEQQRYYHDFLEAFKCTCFPQFSTKKPQCSWMQMQKQMSTPASNLKGPRCVTTFKIDRDGRLSLSVWGKNNDLPSGRVSRSGSWNRTLHVKNNSCGKPKSAVPYSKGYLSLRSAKLGLNTLKNCYDADMVGSFFITRMLSCRIFNAKDYNSRGDNFSGNKCVWEPWIWAIFQRAEGVLGVYQEGRLFCQETVNSQYIMTAELQCLMANHLALKQNPKWSIT